LTKDIRSGQFSISLCPQLSKRERQVLKYLANGRSNKEIGQILYVSEHTAKSHVRAIMTKLNADSRTGVIAVATKLGLIRVVADSTKAYAKAANRQSL
jgi:DNA-binding CsgD family transcriptional regulator